MAVLRKDFIGFTRLPWLVGVGWTEPPPEDLPGRVHQHSGLEPVVPLPLGGADGPCGLAPEPLIASRACGLAHRQGKTVEGVPVPGGMEQGVLNAGLSKDALLVTDG